MRDATTRLEQKVDDGFQVCFGMNILYHLKFWTGNDGEIGFER